MKLFKKLTCIISTSKAEKYFDWTDENNNCTFARLPALNLPHYNENYWWECIDSYGDPVSIQSRDGDLFGRGLFYCHFFFLLPH